MPTRTPQSKTNIVNNSQTGKQTPIHKSISTHASPLEEFEPMWSGAKKADWRRLRDIYQVGNTIDFFEYDFAEKKYTQRWLRCRITHIQNNPKLNIPPGYCIISFEIISRRELSRQQAVRLSSIGFTS